MRILVCASAAPIAPFDGMRTQLRALLDQLAPRHDVTVVAPRWPGQDGPPPAGVDVRWVAPALRPGRDRALSLLRRRPVDVVRLEPPMAAAARDALATSRFDVAHVGLGELAGLADVLAPVPAVLAPLDAWQVNARALAASAVGARRAWLWAQASRVDRYVARAYRPFGAVVAVSAEDAAAINDADPQARTVVIPNGVDATHYRPDGSVPRDGCLLVFTGALHTPANEAAATALARRVLPVVRATLPDARLAIVGRAPSPAVQALASVADGVQVVADAPDVRPWLWRAGAFVAPMAVGTGIKNKLLEAMACATPCATTPLGTRGMDVVDEDQLLIRASTDDLAEAVTALLADPAGAVALGARARRHVVEHHDWAAVARRYESLYAEVAASRAKRAG